MPINHLPTVIFGESVLVPYQKDGEHLLFELLIDHQMRIIACTLRVQCFR